MSKDEIDLPFTRLVILNRWEADDNYAQLKGETLALLHVIWLTNDAKLVADSILWLLESYKLLPTEMGEANANLIFSFMRMFARSIKSYRRLTEKIVYCMKECDCDNAIVDWFQLGGTGFAKSEDEWGILITTVIETDQRTCEQINQLLEQGHGNDSDRIALRIKGLLAGHPDGDAMTMIIKRVMQRMSLI